MHALSSWRSTVNLERHPCMHAQQLSYIKSTNRRNWWYILRHNKAGDMYVDKQSQVLVQSSSFWANQANLEGIRFFKFCLWQMAKSSLWRSLSNPCLKSADLKAQASWPFQLLLRVGNHFYLYAMLLCMEAVVVNKFNMVYPILLWKQQVVHMWSHSLYFTLERKLSRTLH